MKKFFALIVLTVFLALSAVSVFAIDGGLLLDQILSLESVDETSEVIDGLFYSGTLLPWFSAPLGNNGNFYISLGIGLEHENGSPFFLPELLRTELSFNFQNSELQAGRILYADPLGFIAKGLFDGLRFSANTAIGGIGIGLWYTGLLYKDKAQIAITNDDLDSLNADLDYGNF